MYKFILALIILSGVKIAQIYEFAGEFGKFSKAMSFSVNPAGNIYICDADNNEIYKYDLSGKLLKSIGGYGTEASYFDYLADIHSTALHVFVADKNNNRVQIFDKDLNFISSLTRTNNLVTQAGSDPVNIVSPVSCVCSPMEEIFILDSENKEVLKFNFSGNLIARFGSCQSGSYALSYPSKLLITQNSLIVLDKTELIIFDYYGNGITRVKLNEATDNLSVTSDNVIILNSREKLMTADLINGVLSSRNNLNCYGYEFEKNITKGMIYKDRLYVLTENQMLIFNKKKAE
ncbi:MAG: NHL repeat-containing protein [Ignavibacteria bacterium]